MNPQIQEFLDRIQQLEAAIEEEAKLRRQQWQADFEEHTVRFEQEVLAQQKKFKAGLLGYVFNAAFQLDAEGWRKLTLRWGIFFLFLAVLNEVVWRNFSDDVWVSFKVWGTMPITILFTLAQMPLIMKHQVEAKDD